VDFIFARFKSGWLQRVQEKVYKTSITDLDDLKHRIRTEWAKLDHVIIAAAVCQWRRRLSACQGGQWSLRALLLILTLHFCDNSRQLIKHCRQYKLPQEHLKLKLSCCASLCNEWGRMFHTHDKHSGSEGRVEQRVDSTTSCEDLRICFNSNAWQKNTTIISTFYTAFTILRKIKAKLSITHKYNENRSNES